MKIIRRDKGLELHGRLSKGEEVDPHSYLEDDDSIPEPIALIQDLQKGFEKLLAGYPDGLRSGKKCAFDGLAAKLMHSAFDLQHDLLSKREFWIRLSFCEFASVVRFRQPGAKGALAGLDNYALGTLRNSVLFGWWLRGDIGFQAGDIDPYSVCLMGEDVDLWQSHLLRVDYGGCRTFARTFIRYVMDPSSSYFKQLDRQQARELAKLVNRRYATMPLNVFTENESIAILNQLSSALTQ